MNENGDVRMGDVVNSVNFLDPSTILQRRINPPEADKSSGATPVKCAAL